MRISLKGNNKNWQHRQGCLFFQFKINKNHEMAKTTQRQCQQTCIKVLRIVDRCVPTTSSNQVE